MYLCTKKEANAYTDLQRDYTSFANSIQGLSALETSIRNSLHQFAETCKAYSKVMKEMSEKEELLFLNEIHELIAYCHAAKVSDAVLCIYSRYLYHI